MSSCCCYFYYAKKGLTKIVNGISSWGFGIELMSMILGWGSHVLADLAIPKDETTSNHFGALGSSPPRSREGYLYGSQRFMSLKL